MGKVSAGYVSSNEGDLRSADSLLNSLYSVCISVLCHTVIRTEPKQFPDSKDVTLRHTFGQPP